MNYAESFEEFSRGVTPTDLMVYAGAALIVYVLFQNQLSPIKQWVVDFFSSVTNKFKKNSSSTTSLPVVDTSRKVAVVDNSFLQLVSSWKNTRDLAEKMSCSEAVKILDSAFSHLSPNNCVNKNGEQQ